MKRMREISIACIALMLLLTAVAIPYTSAHTWDDPFTTDLIAGGGAGSGEPKSFTDVGEVRVWECTCGPTLYVRYDTRGTGWCLTETHLHVAEELIGIPQTEAKGKGKGNVGGSPIPGHFDYKNEHDCVTVVTYSIDPGEWTIGDELFIAAHAVVYNPCGRERETAWAGIESTCNNGATCFDFDFPGKNWATYFTYEVQAAVT